MSTLRETSEQRCPAVSTRVAGARARWIRACMRVAYGVLAAIVLTLATTCVAAAQTWLADEGASVDASEDADPASSPPDSEAPHETDVPFDETASDPTPSEGEELPESADGETGYMPGPGMYTLSGGVPPPPDMAQDLVPREHALVSQYLPDGLERPPRA
ncbi:MAG: hypothetical protein R3B40_20660 [Polyangiales bacterium]